LFYVDRTLFSSATELNKTEAEVGGRQMPKSVARFQAPPRGYVYV